MCKNQCNGVCENCQNTFEKQISEVQRWSKKLKFDRYEPLQIAKQLAKLIEEAEETNQAVSHFVGKTNDHNATEAKKEIGDVLVVAIILCQKLGFDLLECLTMARNKNNEPDRKPILYDNQIVKRSDLIKMLGDQEADRLINEFWGN